MRESQEEKHGSFLCMDVYGRNAGARRPRRGRGFGLGVSVVIDPPHTETVSSLGVYGWGGAAGTTFWVDPQENILGVFMVQSLPHLTRLKDAFKVLTYQALMESRAP